MKRVIAALIILTGCQETTGPIVTPNGKQAYTVKCSQASSQCLADAGQVCKGPYQVVDSFSKAGGLLADALPGPVTWYYMSFQCGRSDGRMPQFLHRGQHYRQPVSASCTNFGATTNCTAY